VEDQQIAIFRVGSEKRVYALSNQDPFSKAFVMSRGIIGDLQGERVVASPIYKQHFSLATGRCLEDKDQKLLVFPNKIENGKVFISPVPQKTYITNNGVSPEKMKLVLVGNGLAGMRCLEDLLDMAPDRYEITVIGEEPGATTTASCCRQCFLARKPLMTSCCIHMLVCRQRYPSGCR
jgi:nitrite reductase [NAD(P)H], small subunit